MKEQHFISYERRFDLKVTDIYFIDIILLFLNQQTICNQQIPQILRKILIPLTLTNVITYSSQILPSVLFRILMSSISNKAA